MRILYLDVLVAINYGMDFLSLYFAGRILNLPLRRWRLLVAAIPGSVFSIAMIPFEERNALYFFLFFLCGISMAMVAYMDVCGKKTFMLAVLTQLSFAVILGGAINALYAMMDAWLEPNGVGEASLNRSDVFMLLALCGGVLVKGISELLRRRGSGKCIKVHIEAFGRKGNVRLYVDSGHMLHDPITGKIVLILTPHSLMFLPREIRISLTERKVVNDERLARKIRAIPTVGVEGEYLLFGFSPDRIVTEDGRCLSAIVAVGTQQDYNGADGIMPPLAGI